MRDFECAVASRERGEPLFATASQIRRWLLVEVRGSWGRDVVADTDLGRHVPAGWIDKLRAAGVRVIAIRRDLRLAREDGDVSLYYVEAGRGPARPGTMWTTSVERLAGVADATADIGEEPLVGGPPGWSLVDGPLVLLCTNGRHDSCCATYGRPVVRHLRTSPAADVVWECSHVGGDRFAANLVVLPDSIYFGRVTAERVDDLLATFARSELDLELYRGRSTLTYSAQAAEYFLRRQLALTAIDAIVDVRRVAAGRFEIGVAGDDPATGATVVYDVEIERTTTPSPTPLTCSGPSGVSYPVYALVGITRRDRPSPPGGAGH